MGFVNDLKVGEEYEDFILSFLNRYYLPKLSKNKERTGVDLVDLDTGITVEVKFDRQMSTTGNVFIEYQCNGKPSGIFKYSSVDFFIYGGDEFFVVLEMKELLDIVPQLLKKYRSINGGDGWRSKGLLIPHKDFSSFGRVFRISY